MLQNPRNMGCLCAFHCFRGDCKHPNHGTRHIVSLDLPTSVHIDHFTHILIGWSDGKEEHTYIPDLYGFISHWMSKNPNFVCDLTELTNLVHICRNYKRRVLKADFIINAFEWWFRFISKHTLPKLKKYSSDPQVVEHKLNAYILTMQTNLTSIASEEVKLLIEQKEEESKEADRIRLQLEQEDFESKEAKRKEAERLEVERIEAEAAEAERLDVERKYNEKCLKRYIEYEQDTLSITNIMKKYTTIVNGIMRHIAEKQITIHNKIIRELSCMLYSSNDYIEYGQLIANEIANADKIKKYILNAEIDLKEHISELVQTTEYKKSTGSVCAICYSTFDEKIDQDVEIPDINDKEKISEYIVYTLRQHGAFIPHITPACCGVMQMCLECVRTSEPNTSFPYYCPNQHNSHKNNQTQLKKGIMLYREML